MDFTDVGVNALRYALNAFPDASYSVLHVRANLIDMSEPFPVKEEKLPYRAGIFNEKDWADAMRGFICKELKIDKLPILLTVNIKYGDIVTELNKYTDRIDFDAIVMGTRDKYNFFDKFLGTVSLAVAKSCSVPLYLIPRHSTFRGINKVLAAIDYGVENSDYLEKYKNWNQEQRAFTKFLHIKPISNLGQGIKVKPIIYKLLEAKKPNFDFEIAELTEETIGQSLLATAYNQKSDILAIMPKEQGLISSIFFQSISKDIIIKAEIPILFIK